MSMISRIASYDNATSKRIALVYGCNPRKQNRYHGLDYGHIEVQIAREVDFKIDGPNVDAGYRWTEWSNGTPRAYYIDGLFIRCQFDLSGSPENDPMYLYGFHTRFMEKSYIDVDGATAMYRTLKRAESAKVDACSGHGVEFARYVHAVLDRLGVDEYMCYTNDTVRGDMSRKSNFQSIPNFRELYKTIDRLVSDIRAS